MTSRCICNHSKNNSLDTFEIGSYPIVSDMALKLLMPFPSTCLCEAAFSSMLVIKTKARNRLDEPDLRCCLAVTEPRIQKLVDEKQHQK